MAQAAPAPDPTVLIAQAFVQHYYTTFDNDRSKLVALYQDSSKFTFEGKPAQGQQAILASLLAIPFQKIVHNIKTLDVQPSGCNGLIVFVTGDFTGDATGPLKFTQAFHLMPAANNNFWVHNDVFRIG